MASCIGCSTILHYGASLLPLSRYIDWLRTDSFRLEEPDFTDITPLRGWPHARPGTSEAHDGEAVGPLGDKAHVRLVAQRLRGAVEAVEAPNSLLDPLQGGPVHVALVHDGADHARVPELVHVRAQRHEVEAEPQSGLKRLREDLLGVPAVPGDVVFALLGVQEPVIIGDHGLEKHQVTGRLKILVREEVLASEGVIQGMLAAAQLSYLLVLKVH